MAGVSPAYIKELLRKAALLAAEQGAGAVVREEQVAAAMDELSQGGRLAERILGFRPLDAPGSAPGQPGQPGLAGQATQFGLTPGPALQTGYPAAAWSVRSATIGRQGE
jgi:hypothetical protein